MFGLELRNNNNSLLIADNEQPLLYYGKITVSTTYWDSFPLFNLPSGFPCQIFSVVTSGSDFAEASTYIKDGRWHVMVTGKSSSPITLDIFVFTSAMAFPKTTWGVEVYSNSNLIFIGSRPMLDVISISTATVDTASMSTGTSTHSPIVTSSSKVAAQSMLMWIKSIMTGMGQFSIFRYNIIAFSSGGVHKHGVGVLQSGNGTASYTQGIYNTVNYGIIDCAYYEGFTTLPNYV